MKKTAKTWYITAAALVLMGCILFIGVMSSVGWNVSRLSAVSFETRIHEIAEPFRDLSLTTDTANIVFARSEDGRCRVACYEEANAAHSVTVENGVLLIRRIDQRSWYDHIGFRFSSPRITVYLPQAEYGALSVCESTGAISTCPKGSPSGAWIFLPAPAASAAPQLCGRPSGSKRAPEISASRMLPPAPLTFPSPQGRSRSQMCAAQGIFR